MVKIDAFAITQSQVGEAHDLLAWNEGIGTWRLNKAVDIKFPNNEKCLLTTTINKLPGPVEFKSTSAPLTNEDEYVVGKLCGLMEQHKRAMIKAEYGGCGKSYAGNAMRTKGHNVLLVCPTSQLASQYGEHGCTVNRFFGVGSPRTRGWQSSTTAPTAP